VAVVIATNLRKELSGDALFDGVSFKVERRDRGSSSSPFVTCPAPVSRPSCSWRPGSTPSTSPRLRADWSALPCARELD
jgi:hypothetical protein